LDRLIADLDAPPEPASQQASSPTASGASAPAALALTPPVPPEGPAPMLSTPATVTAAAGRPAGRRWWMWTLAAAVVGAGATAAVLALSPSSEPIRDGSLATLRR